MISPIYAYFWEDGNCLDAGGLEGGIGISTADVKKIVSVKIQDEKIVTIENLTLFFSFSCGGVCAVYLGGFCNHLRFEISIFVNIILNYRKIQHRF